MLILGLGSGKAEAASGAGEETATAARGLRVHGFGFTPEISKLPPVKCFKPETPH
jgi:hypothetical protein